MEIVDKIEDRLYKCAPDVQAKGFTKLMLCVLHNDLKNAEHYLKNINSKNSEGQTALHIACINSKTSSEIVDFLLKNGADPNAKDNYDKTPLHYSDDIAKVKILIKYNADPNARDKSGWTPLHDASIFSTEDSYLEIIMFLVRNGADPNAKENDDWTPLHCATKYSSEGSDISLKTIEFLLRNGADPNARTKNTGLTPLHFACASRFSKTVELLLRYGAIPINEEMKRLKLELENRSLRKDVTNLQLKVNMIEKLLKEHFDCAPDGPLYVEAKNRFANRNY